MLAAGFPPVCSTPIANVPDLSPAAGESKLARVLREALLDAAPGFSVTRLSHLCQEVRQVVADELTRNKPRKLGPAPSDQRGKDQAIGFDLGWDAARSEVLMPTWPLTD